MCVKSSMLGLLKGSEDRQHVAETLVKSTQSNYRIQAIFYVFYLKRLGGSPVTLISV